MTRCVVIGHRGMLGQAVDAALRRRDDLDVVGVDRDAVDISAPATVTAACFDGAAVLFNCAAYTDVDGAEAHAAAARAVNARGVEHLAEVAERQDAVLVHLSTDYVFDGEGRRPYRPEDPPHPLCAYGRSKRAGEVALDGSACRSLCVRTAWLYGPGGKNFVDTMRRLAGERERLEVVCDQIGSPTYTGDLAEALVDLWRAGATGVFHCTNRGAASWYQLACAVMVRLGARVEMVPVTSDEFSRPARRPAYGVLDCTASEQVLGRSLRHWEDALDDYLGVPGGAVA